MYPTTGACGEPFCIGGEDVQSQLQHIIQQPDLLFFQFCERHFRVNKGVFHTIDCRLYELGFEKVKKRRYVMLQFLQHANESAAHSTKYIKFGHGNLNKTLDHFLMQHEQLQTRGHTDGKNSFRARHENIYST
ncbi:hypothetical protein A6K76_04195 [Caryophanon latum]|uniref:Uncharacterized protein n=1 Tax=Caryophanon latum TaxID=33977 RepID=A0A1C0Z4A3_9BACL|nr:hypothetical protein A6K76_04195 [Caryophanon latum]